MNLFARIFRVLLLCMASSLLYSATLHHSEYFQQYVKYDIDVKLDIDYRQLKVKETLLYTNNSPDTLTEIYFHLYLNKYRKGSLAFPNLTFDRGSIIINKMEENDSLNTSGIIDETLFKVALLNPLYPGYSVRFSFDFVVTLPLASGRLGYYGDHYDVGNWYVTPVVYDRAGWHLHQHLDNEFYQEWGDFRVNIHVPKGFLVGATGNLLNSFQAYQDTLKENRDHYLIHPEDTLLSVWQYEAKMVHDFAWTTDPAYVLIQSEWNGITFNVLAMDYNAEDWKQVAEWGPKAVQFLSEAFGMYPYDQMTVADTYIKAGGIEYPQITFINDMIHPIYEPDQFKSTIIHEMAHNWYYGLLGSNQTEEGWMDEGFTTFAEIKTMEALFGRYTNYSFSRSGWLSSRFSLNDDDRLENARSYLRLAKMDFDRDHINMHPDYMGQEGYYLEYAKSAIVLFMLEYTIGDSLFAGVMLDYFDKWHFKHPYPQDFVSVAEKYADRDLDWFFEQWWNTNRKLDYSVNDVDGEWKQIDLEKKYHCLIEFERKSNIFMPIDFDVTLVNGKVLKYQIPVDNYPKPEQNRKPLKYWHFSQKKYQAELFLDAEVEKVEIDPSLRLMDINMLNNNSQFFPDQEFHFMKYGTNLPSLNKYEWEFWPIPFYNDYDKLKLGFNLNGRYLYIDHKIDLWLWYKTAWGNVDFDISYKTPVRWLGRLTQIYFNSFTLDGRQGGQISISHSLDENWREEPSYNIEMGIANHKMFDCRYLMAPWSGGDVNIIFFNWSMQETYYNGWKPKTILDINYKSSTLNSNYSFSQISLEWYKKIWNSYSNWELDFRLFTGYSDGNIPAQYLFNISGDNGWGEFQQSFYRSQGSLPYPWRKNGNLYKWGGGNVRGYSLTNDFITLLAPKIAAINIDLLMPNPLESLYIPIIEDMNPVFFIDYGSVWHKEMPPIKSFKKSAGIGITMESPFYLDELFNLRQVRVDFPVWLSDVASNEKNTSFRWLIRFDFTY